MNRWTEAQRQVIYSDARELICSAAAGSGKTAVLVERIARFLREGADPAAFLVITFTRAAASEMREKIRNRLLSEQQNPEFRTSLDQIDQMQISTIHSFCQELLRDQFQVFSIDPLFTICDTSQGQMLFHEAFVEACNQLEETEADLFSRLKVRYELKKAEQMVETLYGFLMSLPDPGVWLQNAVEGIPDRILPGHPWFQALSGMAADAFYQADLCLHRMESLLNEQEALEAYRKVWEADRTLFHVKQSAFSGSGQPEKKNAFVRLPTVKGLTVLESDWKDRYQKQRDQFKKLISRVDDLSDFQSEKYVSECRNLRETLLPLAKLTELTGRLFREKKIDRALLDFHDLEQLSTEMLEKHPQVQREIQSRYRYIFVDECQDISRVQDRLISLLFSSDNHLFMVGDVKQSIYRFRLADPMLFLSRIQSCSSGEKPSADCIYLQSNFRSRPEILETANLIFRSLMKKETAELDYEARDMLIPGRKTSGFFPVCADILSTGSGEKEVSPLELVANYVTDQIHLLLSTDNPETGRKYTYRDCVILMPAVATDGPKLARMLEDRQIPVFFDGMGSFYEQQEIQVIRNLLLWIDNPFQDLPLISVLQNLPFSFSDETLAAIRLCAPGKVSFCEAFLKASEEDSSLGDSCRKVMEKHSLWQDMSESLRLCDFLWYLYDQTGIYWAAATDNNGETQQANMRMLIEQSVLGESRGILTLRQFLSVLNEQQQFGDLQSATVLGDQDDLVRIMTVHKSKGLQFPVVFCCGMDHQLLGSAGRSLLCHSELGLCVEYKDPAHRIARPALASEIFLWQKRREELAEKIRLLYVAMTRAQERLFLVTVQETNPIWSMPDHAGRILSAVTFTDLWMPVLMQDGKKISTGNTQAEKPYKIRVLEGYSQKTVNKHENIHSRREWLDTLLSEPVVDDLWKDSAGTNPPALKKRSVTSLIRSARQKLKEEDQEEVPETKRTPEALARRLLREDLPEMPLFLRQKKPYTPALRGTIVHRILSSIDLGAIRAGADPSDVLRREKERMRSEHILSSDELSVVQDGQILSFLSSEMGKRMIQADEIHREWNFNLRVARDDQEMILQGVIDCAFREKDAWVVLDYKTDEIRDPDAFVEEYRPQILWYVRAVEKLTAYPVREAALYSLTLGRIFPVFREEN